MEEFLNEAWEREIFKLFVGLLLFSLGFVASGVREHYKEKRKRRSEKIFFETRLIKLINELKIFTDGIEESSIDDTNIFVPQFSILQTYTLKEIKLVDQIKLFYEYVGKAKKKDRQKITNEFDLLMITLDNVSRLYEEIPKQKDEYLSKYKTIHDQWNEAMREIDIMYSELLGRTNMSKIEELSLAKKFLELRTKSYAEQKQKDPLQQFTIDSANEGFVNPLRELVHDYSSTKYAQRLNPSLIKLEEVYREYNHAKLAIKMNDKRFETELKGSLRTLAQFMLKHGNKSLEKYGY